ncbi:hypothetical protein PDUR_26465 [Paenibacillus durus]|uniref:Uncharacterized protein n=1 Tax=Paenibacillus durus TaxID=44251 RepID=A0A089HVB1_PAEDU|nr:hypothetical protein PDUR_26465 [Paenibacillus durus]
MNGFLFSIVLRGFLITLLYSRRPTNLKVVWSQRQSRLPTGRDVVRWFGCVAWIHFPEKHLATKGRQARCGNAVLSEVPDFFESAKGTLTQLKNFINIFNYFVFLNINPKIISRRIIVQFIID